MIVSTLEALPGDVAKAGLGAPSVVVVGDVVRLREQLNWWEKVPLFGMRTLVTRASHQAREIAAALRAAGALPILNPMIELLPVDDAEGLGRIERAFADLAHYDAILFNSTNTVRYLVEHARRLGLEAELARARARVLCVGGKTARVAFESGLSVSYAAASGGDAETVLEEILKVLPPKGQRILIPRSEIGRNVLPDGLRDAGAQVDAIEIYRNVAPEVDAQALREELMRGGLEILTFTSPSTANNFVALLDEPALEAARGCIIAAIGVTTARALRKAGLPPDVVPDRPDVRELVATLATHVGEFGRGSR